MMRAVESRRSPNPPATFSLLVAAIGVVACSACSTGPATAQAPNAAATSQAPAAAPNAPQSGGPEIFTGKVVETMDSGGYTYVRLQSEKDKKDVWIAASQMVIKTGDRLTVPLEMPMTNFHSPSLNRDFPLVYFVSQVAGEGQSLGAAPGAAAPPLMSSRDSGMASQAGASPHTGAPQSGPATVKPNAPPAGGLSVADTWAKRASLAGKPITVRGTVVKVNNAIMGVNWFHLQDGSGKAADGTNDLTVTTDAIVKVGDVITVTGTVAVKKDFGAGYAYEVIVEKATVK